MRVLLTNDDGYAAPGLAALRKAAEASGAEVAVVAPDREQSASSHALTIHRPLRVRKSGDRTWVVDGTPTDCVNMALCRILRDERPDFVLSGVNAGPNLGDDVTYSGTVAAAFEGTLLGVPSIAFSLDTDARFDFGPAHDVVRRVLDYAKTAPPAPGTLWNVNIPGRTPRGTRVTRLGHRRYEENVVEKTDPRGRPYFWIGGARVDRLDEGTDLTAVADGYVSITPLHLDMTHYEALEGLKPLEEGA